MSGETRDELVDKITGTLAAAVFARYQATRREFGVVVAMDELRATLADLEAVNAQ
jgi:hypothetical protein